MPALRRQIADMERDIQMVADLKDVYEQQAEKFVAGMRVDRKAICAKYQRLYATFGIERASVPVDDQARLIRESAIREELIASLHQWWFLSDAVEGNRQSIEQLIEASDDDPFRREFRAAAQKGDVEKLTSLAQDARATEQPGMVLTIVADVLGKMVGPESKLALLRSAYERNPGDFWVNMNLGVALMKSERPQFKQAVGFARAALAIRSNSPGALTLLGNCLKEAGELDESLAYHNRVLKVMPDSAEAHSNLGTLLERRGDLSGAIACYRHAISLNPDLAEIHTNLGHALTLSGKPNEAIACLHTAIKLNPDLYEAHNNMGVAQLASSAPQAAIASFERAVELRPGIAEPHYNLGNALLESGDPEKAVVLYRTAIGLDPSHPESYCNLGDALRKLGRFPASLEAYVRGHELGSRRPNWRYPSATWVEQARELVRLDERLAGVLAGKDEPTSAEEQIEFGQLCYAKGSYHASQEFYFEGLRKKPQLANDLNSGYRYNAACSAALAAAGKGNDAQSLGNDRRQELRQTCLNWLKEDYSARKNLAQAGNGTVAPAIWRQLADATNDPDLASVREPSELAKLPEEERRQWEQLWKDVNELLQKLQAANGPNAK